MHWKHEEIILEWMCGGRVREKRPKHLQLVVDAATTVLVSAGVELFNEETADQKM